METAQATEEVKPAEVQTEAAEESTLLGTEGKEVEGQAEAVKKDETEKPEGEAAKEKTAADKPTVPEKYEFKVPEGMALDNVLVEKVSPIFKELGISQEGAQKLVDAYAPYVQQQVEAQQKAAIDLWKGEVNGWKEQTLKDLGANAPKEMAFAAKFIDRFGTKIKGEDGKEVNALRSLFDETGIGNHPALVKALIQAGKSISQDSFADPSKQSGQGDAAVLYDHPTSKANLK